VQIDHPGNLFVIAAPSGAGKSSLVKALMAADPRLRHSVSHTTRPPRGQEQSGREYHFVGSDEFDAMVQRNEFFEWAHVHGNRYGTSRKAIEQDVIDGHDVILEIDYQGAFKIKSLFAHAVLVFILPPSLNELQSRIENRGEDPPERIALRLTNASVEMAQAPRFDFVIINDLFERALSDLQAVVHVQRLKYAAQRRNRADVFQALHLN
jgi:guanylate kinase